MSRHEKVPNPPCYTRTYVRPDVPYYKAYERVSSKHCHNKRGYKTDSGRGKRTDAPDTCNGDDYSYGRARQSEECSYTRVPLRSESPKFLVSYSELL